MLFLTKSWGEVGVKGLDRCIGLLHPDRTGSATKGRGIKMWENDELNFLMN